MAVRDDCSLSIHSRLLATEDDLPIIHEEHKVVVDDSVHSVGDGQHCALSLLALLLQSGLPDDCAL